MGLREDIKFILDENFEPRIPDNETILKQARKQLKNGKSTGNINLDVKAIRSFQQDEER